MNLHKALEAEHPALKVAQYRHLWVDLSHMMQQLGTLIVCLYFYISIAFLNSKQLKL